MANRKQILQKLRAYKKNPDLISPLSSTELADLVLVVLSQVDVLEKAIKDGRLDGKTPQPDKEYESKETTQKRVTQAINEMMKKTDSVLSEKSSELDQRVAESIARLRDGNDGVVTEEEIGRAANLALSMIDLPDFDELVQTAITSDGESIRNALELLSGDERYKVEISDVEGLEDRLESLRRSEGGNTMATSKPAVYQFIRDAIADGVISSGGSSTVSVDGTEVSDPDFVSTGDVDFESSGSNVTGDVIGLRGTPLDSTVASPTDGKILVYRNAGTDWVLEDKPAGGSNPALNDVTDVTITTVGDNNLLAYDTTSGEWINQTASEAGLATTGDLHDAVTVTDSSEIDFTLTGQDITASLIAGSIDETKLDTSVNASLDLADSALQSGDNVSTLTNDAGYITASSTDTLTNKTIDGDNNTISNLAIGAEVTGAIGDLSNVSITSASNKETLNYDGSNWVNEIDPNFKEVYNNTASTITQGTVVHITGSAGGFPLITEADKDTDSAVSGIAIEDIGAATVGKIQATGTLQETYINTFGMTAGNPVYLGDNGTYTDTRPTSGNVIQIGVVGVAASSGGSLLLSCPALAITTDSISEDDKTGSDTDFVTGTAGTSGNLVQWNADGDAVDSSLATSDVYSAGGTDVAIADGGTGASTASGAFANLKQSASTTATGVVELATAAETTTGTDTSRVVTPDGLAGSDYGKRIVQAQIVEGATDVATGDGAGNFRFFIPEELNGYNLVNAHAAVVTAGTTGTSDVQLHNVTDAVDMLSTKITIDSGEKTSYTAATAPVINGTNDDVATGDEIRVDVDAVSTTAPKGLSIILTFQLP